MKGDKTMDNYENEIFTKTEKEYAKLDKLYAKKRELFDNLKSLESVGKYGTEIWKETFTKYAVTFKALHGYNPHWARG